MAGFEAGIEAVSSFTLAHEAAIRLGAFAGITAAVAAWEYLAPRRGRAVPRWARWPHNFGVAALSTLAVRLLVPTAAVGFAIMAQSRGWGLFNAVSLPLWVEMAICVVVLDLVIYLQHVLFHTVPPLWWLHRMHHTDLDVDVTTGVRFHPVEILLSAGVKIGAVAVLGAAPAAVVIFEVLLNATAMFNHGNVRVPAALERVLRWFIVTPDMHRVHHSILPLETNSNFSFNLPWWDRLFGTYRDQPAGGHVAMSIGIDGFLDPRQLRLDRMLAQPFMSGSVKVDAKRGG